MDCLETILSRRSIRAYRPDSIPDAVIDKILTGAMYAPSADNLQPWFFVVVKTPSAICRLLGIMKQVPKRLDDHLKHRFPRHPDVVAETKHFLKLLGGAPTCVLVFQREPLYSNDSRIIQQSIAASIENALITAWSFGIGSCWLTAPLEANVYQLIQNEFAPDKGPLAALFTLGYPADIPLASLRKKDRYIII